MKIFAASLLALVALVNGKSIDLFRPSPNYGYITNVGIPMYKEMKDYEEENPGISYSSRVQGGQPAVLGQFPWQVLLHVEFSGLVAFAGASLISSDRVLTAAHNWNDGEKTGDSITVFLGTTSISGAGGISVPVSNIVLHPGYNAALIMNDVAVLSLSSPVKFSSTISTVALPFNSEINDDFEGAIATASGFGNTPTGITGGLNYVELTVISNEECRKDFGASVQSSNICTSGKGLIGICSGDSGGPLVTFRNNKAIQIGIASFGSAVCGTEQASAFVRVTSFASFIQSNM